VYFIVHGHIENYFHVFNTYQQGRIKGWGATRAIAPGPPLTGRPRDDIYLF